MPLIELPPLALVAVDVAAWAAIHSLSGYSVHRLPVSALQHDNRLLAPRRFERDGRFYRNALRIHRWKDRLPEAGSLFPGGISKRHLPPRSQGGLQRFVVETRRAELGHWLAIAPAPLFALFNPPIIAAVMVGYAVAINLPFIAVQRYNRLRATRALRASGSPGDDAARARNDAGTTGTSMP